MMSEPKSNGVTRPRPKHPDLRTATLAVLAFAACGTEPEIPQPSELTIAPCGTSMDCLGEGSHEGRSYGWNHDCAFTFAQCRYFRVDLLNSDGSLLPWGPNPVVPDGECIDIRWTGFTDREFGNWVVRNINGPGVCRQSRIYASTFVSTRLPGFGGSSTYIGSAVVEVWDWMQGRWVQCWSEDPFTTCEIRYADEAVTPRTI